MQILLETARPWVADACKSLRVQVDGAELRLVKGAHVRKSGWTLAYSVRFPSFTATHSGRSFKTLENKLDGFPVFRSFSFSHLRSSFPNNRSPLLYSIADNVEVFYNNMLDARFVATERAGVRGWSLLRGWRRSRKKPIFESSSS